MSADLPANSRLKTYSDREYVHTTLVRHQGTTVALAVDKDRRLYYTVLDLNGQATDPHAADPYAAPDGGADPERHSALDVNHWSEEPKELRFPTEIARCGYGAAGAAALPRVPLGGGAAEEGPDTFLLDDEVDPFRSSTARLTAAYAFQAVSDGKHIFVFRQAVGGEHPDALYRLKGGGTTGDKAHKQRQISAKKPVQVAPDALLCDRFVLNGSELTPVQEVRYRRSRHRDEPESAKDSLGTADMDGRPFYEPTLELGFAGKVTRGRFAVLLVPTAVADTSRWQFFLADAAGTGIEAVNVEQAEDGLFHTLGSRLYACTNPACKSAVLDRSERRCESCTYWLKPVAPDARFAESALSLDGGYVELATGADKLLPTAAYTLEAWVRPTSFGGTIFSTLGGADGTAKGGIKVALDADGNLVVTHGLADGSTAEAMLAGMKLAKGVYQHIGIRIRGTELMGWRGGYWWRTTTTTLAPASAAGTRLLIGAAPGADGTPGDFFAGEIDEVRLWNTGRAGTDITTAFATRLLGDEPRLAAYYRCDEGSGTTLHDHSGHGRSATLGGTTAWVASGAPIADHPGIRRERFQVKDRKVVGGLSAVLHHQQEEGAVGHEGTPRPLKRQARVLVAWTAGEKGANASANLGRIATLDVAVAQDGRLAQLPDVLDLPEVGGNVQTADPARENVLKQEEIPAAEAELARATRALEQLKEDVKDTLKLNTEIDDALSASMAAKGLTRTHGATSDCLVVIHLGNAKGSDGDYYRHLRVTTDSANVARAGHAPGLPEESDKEGRWKAECSDDPWAFGGSASGAAVRWALSNVAVGASLKFRGREVVFTDPGEEATYAGGGLTYSYDRGMERWRELVWKPSSGFSAPQRGGVDADPVDLESGSVDVYVVPTAPDPANEAAVKATADVIDGLRRAGEVVAARTDTNHISTLTAKQTQLANQLKSLQEELGRVSGGTKGRSDHTEPTAHLGRDRCGLGYSGALLDFAKTGTTPHLTDSGTGHLGLYFRDEEERLTGLFYDTNVGRSGKTLKASDGTTVQLTARDAGVDLADVKVTVTADTTGPFADRCTLTLTAKDGESETWALLPRRATALADALNGLRAEPARIGTVSSLKGGVLTLDVHGASRKLAAGDLLDVGGEVYALKKAVAAKATELIVKHGPKDAQLPADTPVRLVSYDPSLVTHTTLGSTAAFGSRLVTAALIGTAGSVVDGTAKDEGEARPPRWWGDLPGRALIFTDTTTPPALPEAVRETVKHHDDLTVEAWLRPKAADNAGDAARIVHARVPDSLTGTESRYTLALGAPDGEGRRPLVAGVGGSLVTSRATVPGDAWTHVAAAFEQSWALDFAHGRAVVEAPHAEDLDISRDLTLEVFLQARQLTGVQGLVSKGRIDDGTGKRVPYQLSLRADGKLAFAFEGGTGTEILAVSTAKVTAGKFHRIAVVRKLSSSREETMGKKLISLIDAAGASVEREIDALTGVTVVKHTDLTFYIDGKEAGHTRYDDTPDLGHPGPLDIGRARRGGADQPFSGIISEVRIWNTARAADVLGKELPREAPASPTGIPVRQEGLVAHWRFEENEGNAAQDETGGHTAKVRGARWTKNPDPRGSRFRLYLNGRATEALPVTKATQFPYGAKQFTLGARTADDSTTTADRYLGILEEVRVWRTARTEEQLLDNLHGRLTGDTADLLAYYPFDDESTDADATQLLDHGPRGCHLPLSATAAEKPQPVMSTAPISSDTPEVRSAFATGQPLFVQKITAAPSVSEYADLQVVRDGSTRGVLKRVYTYVQNGQWQLVTGFKLGDLKSEWVGQVQFAPQLVGYVEGAPPVPSENLVATRRPGSLSYLNTTSVEFKQADEVVQTLSSSKDTSVDVSLEYEASAEFNYKSRIISAPLGIGISMPITDVAVNVRGGAGLEFSNGWGDQTELSEGVNTTRSTLVGLGGGWEPEDHMVDPAGGRRFQPTNIGFALVQSETADVYALRLAHSGAVVAYRMLPNPDIPRDWNLLPFAINPRYIKQGTLDGTVGFKDGAKLFDADYAGAGDRGDYSYFKPKEAYALKRRIVEDMQRRQAYYDGVSTASHTTDPTAERARGLLSSFMGPVRSPQGARGDSTKPGKEVAGFARRDIVNTYAWSADGGFFAETTETTDVVTETTSGAYSFTGKATAGATAGFSVAGVGMGLQLDASLGGSLTRTRSRSREATRSFSLDVQVDTPGDLQLYDKDSVPQYDADGNAIEVPGRVDAYRFMTFYLDSDKANFEDFFGKVVDPTWLNGPTANAAALRQANQADHKPPCWRVLHRVTFVSRKLPDTVGAGAPPLEKAMREANVASNFELVRKLEPYVDRAVRSRSELAVRVRDAIKTHLPELTPHSETIEKFFGDYYGLEDLTA
ncbi:LamG-like jellyroll fold domain-containing protein [Streptomyces sp. NPDC021093]|uniref:LamG-like jellyroll fold domain-containing protein n=1 Tax=Streptomyces sp. NPDC021093 TaxID=3365112 RepID=UPI00378D1420